MFYKSYTSGYIFITLLPLIPRSRAIFYLEAIHLKKVYDVFDVIRILKNFCCMAWEILYPIWIESFKMSFSNNNKPNFDFSFDVVDYEDRIEISIIPKIKRCIEIECSYLHIFWSRPQIFRVFFLSEKISRCILKKTSLLHDSSMNEM